MTQWMTGCCLVLTLVSFSAQAGKKSAKATEASAVSSETITETSTANGEATAIAAAAGGSGVVVAAGTTGDTTGSATSVTDGKIDAAKAATLKESEIPLQLDKAKKTTEEGGGLGRMMMTALMLAILGGGAYFAIKKYSIPKGSVHQTQIKVLQQHYLGPKKSLAIIRVAGESILIGVTDTNISLIKSLSLLDEDIPEASSDRFPKEMITSETTTAKFAFTDKTIATKSDEAEEFAFSGIKDVVTKKIQNMRSL